MEDTLTSGANSEEQSQQGTETTEKVDQNTDNGADLDQNSSSSESETTTTEEDKKEEAPAKEFDADLDEWAQKTGRAIPTTDRERELYQEIRNQAREYGKSKQSKESLQEVTKAEKENSPLATGDNANDLEGEVFRLRQRVEQEETNRLRAEYFQENGVTLEESKVMGELLKEVAESKDVEGFKFLTNPKNLNHWHNLAKSRLADSQADARVEAAKAEERQRLAKESQAGPVGRSAKAASTSDKTEAEAQLERFSNWD